MVFRFMKPLLAAQEVWHAFGGGVDGAGPTLAPSYPAVHTRDAAHAGGPGVYIVGVLLAIGAGLADATGLLCQKWVVDRTPRGTERGYFASITRQPLWLLGLALQMVVGTACFLLAVRFLGPALVPGLMAVSLVALAVGSVILLGESLSLREGSGIALLVVAVVAIGLSGLTIDVAAFDLAERGFLGRAGAFTVAAAALIVALEILQRRHATSRVTTLSLQSGLHFALTNFWVGILAGTGTELVGGRTAAASIVLFALSAAILIATNVLGIRAIQLAFRTGRANLAVPIQQVPVQLAPGIVFLAIFGMRPPSASAALLYAAGVALAVGSSFLLGRFGGPAAADG
jgi:hypothetical protein